MPAPLWSIGGDWPGRGGSPQISACSAIFEGGGGGDLSATRERTALALIGRSVPDFSLVNGERTGELLRNGRGLLLEFGVVSPLEAVARQWAGRLDHVLCEAEDSLGLSAVLIRPDGIVAWATEAAPNTDEFAWAARRWFGGPARANRQLAFLRVANR